MIRLKKRRIELLLRKREKRALKNKKKIDISKGSPCGYCSRLNKNKNEGECLTCIKPYLYSVAIERESPYCKAIDFSQVYALNRLEAVHTYIDGGDI